MNLIEVLQKKLGEPSDIEELPEVSDAMLKRLEEGVAGANLWCKAMWVDCL